MYLIIKLIPPIEGLLTEKAAEQEEDWNAIIHTCELINTREDG
jgi:hypothetical protein